VFNINIETVVFTDKINEYQRLTQKAMADVLKEQARLLAERLAKLTYPASYAQGRKRVSIDIGRVYLSNRWFEEIFQFKNQKLGERVKDAVYGKDQTTLEAIFQNSTRLNRIRIEPFDRARHKSLRRAGRVLVPNPFSFPLSQQSDVNALVKEKQGNVGLAKRGWANCAAQLGKTVPKWLSKSGAGQITDRSADSEDAYIILSNQVPFFSALDARSNIVSRALEGRGRDMVRSAQKQLEEAKQKAGLE